MIAQRTRIQNALIAAAAAYDFPVVTYNKDTGAATADEATTIKPKTNLSNETKSGFERDDKQGRKIVRERSGWKFELRLKFDKEVLLDGFVDSVTDTQLRLEPDDANGLLGVLLELDNMDVEHPVQQDSASGTQVTFDFTANVFRK